MCLVTLALASAAVDLLAFAHAHSYDIDKSEQGTEEMRAKLKAAQKGIRESFDKGEKLNQTSAKLYDCTHPK